MVFWSRKRMCSISICSQTEVVRGVISGVAADNVGTNVHLNLMTKINPFLSDAIRSLVVDQ